MSPATDQYEQVGVTQWIQKQLIKEQVGLDSEYRNS